MHRPAARRIVDNVFWLTIQESLSRLIGFLLVMLLARMLSAETLGAMNICLALMAILTILVRAGTGSRGTRLTARSEDNIAALHAEITGLRVLMGLVIVAAIVAASEALAALLSVPRPLLLIGSALLVQPALSVAWAFRGIDDMRAVALATIGERTVVICGVIALFGRQDLGGEPILLLEIAGATLHVAFLRWRLRQCVGVRLRYRPQPCRWGPMLRESTPLSVAAVTASVYRYADLLLAGILVGGATAARFLIPQKIALTLLVLPVLVGKASFPSVCREIHSDPHLAAAQQGRLLRLTFLPLLPACAAIAFFAEEFLGLLFGPAYAMEAPTLGLLLLSAPFFAYGVFQENLLLAAPRPKTVLVARAASAGAHLVASFLLIPRFGAAGAAAGCLLGQFLFAVIASWAWHRAGGQLPFSRRTLLAPAGAVLMWPLMHHGTNLLGSSGGLAVAAFAYLSLMLVFGELAALELRRGLQLLLPGTHRGSAR